jgi:hypothetical protein
MTFVTRHVFDVCVGNWHVSVGTGSNYRYIHHRHASIHPTSRSLLFTIVNLRGADSGSPFTSVSSRDAPLQGGMYPYGYHLEAGSRYGN